jgi:hypothetical protein
MIFRKNSVTIYDVHFYRNLIFKEIFVRNKEMSLRGQRVDFSHAYETIGSFDVTNSLTANDATISNEQVSTLNVTNTFTSATGNFTSLNTTSITGSNIYENSGLFTNITGNAINENIGIFTNITGNAITESSGIFTNYMELPALSSTGTSELGSIYFDVINSKLHVFGISGWVGITLI